MYAQINNLVVHNALLFSDYGGHVIGLLTSNWIYISAGSLKINEELCGFRFDVCLRCDCRTGT